MTYRQCGVTYGEHHCVLSADHAGLHRAEAAWPDVVVSWPNADPPRKPRTRKPKVIEQLEGQMSIFDVLGEP